jgi:flagellar biosynthetic protein FliR
MPDLLNWLLVFLRASALLAIFPVFSISNVPVQIRVALGALISFLVAPILPAPSLAGADFWKVIGVMFMEVAFGLLLGFAARMLFYALDIAGAIIGAEIGLTIPSSLNPMSTGQTTEAATVLHYLAAMIFLTLNLHHGLLLAFQRSYHFLPVGGGHLQESLLLDLLGRTSHLFWFALQMSAPLLAISFIITLVFAVLSRAVPQMNVFVESFTVRILVGLTVFSLTCQLMGQHIANYLGRLPEDVLKVAQLLGAK